MLFNNLILVSWDGKITAYGYDAAGQLVQQTEYGQSNNEGRLKDRPETWHIHHFKRNILGQLIEKQSRKVSHKNGQSKDEGISRTRFDYDPITGNLTKARNRHSSVELTYDELDRLIGETTVHNGQSATVGYRYDPLGNRIRTILPDGRHIDYLYYGSGHLHQISLDGEVVSDIERDKLHREIQRTQGSISSLYDYDPMGRLKKNERVYKDAHQPFRLQNQYYDSETGLHYNYFRYYDSETGRFVSQDVIGLVGGETFYQFSPNTQSWIDPLGLKELYYLTAAKDGFYPVMEWGKRKPVGKVWLKKGDIWKIGETRNVKNGIQRRYSQAWLRRNDLIYKRVMKGPKIKMRIWERLKILKYIKRRGKLPPGNKCKY